MVLGLKGLIISYEGLRYSLLPCNMKYTERWGKIVMYSITKSRLTSTFVLLMSASGLLPLFLATLVPKLVLDLLFLPTSMLLAALFPLPLPTTSPLLLLPSMLTMSSLTLMKDVDLPRIPMST